MIRYDEAARLHYLAGALARARRLRGLSARELGRRAGLSPAVVAKIERGEASPSWATVDRLAAALGLPVTWFQGDDRGEGAN